MKLLTGRKPGEQIVRTRWVIAPITALAHIRLNAAFLGYLRCGAIRYSIATSVKPRSESVGLIRNLVRNHVGDRTYVFSETGCGSSDQ